MSDPKFKPGDKVQIDGKGEVLQIGERVEPLIADNGEPYFYRRPEDHCYTLKDGQIGARVCPEDWLTRVEQWERCPGKHRIMGQPEARASSNMERLVGSDT